MIAFLSGTAFLIYDTQVVLLAGGVGYLVAVPPSTLAALEKNQELKLFIYTHVREDALELYGFTTKEELDFFMLVLGVSGVGPKTALMVVNRGVGGAIEAVQRADTHFFTLVPRLGLKIAQKIIIELKGKLGSISDLDLTGGRVDSEVALAMEAMGYSKREAEEAASKVPKELSTLEEKVRFALRQTDAKSR